MRAQLVSVILFGLVIHGKKSLRTTVLGCLYIIKETLFSLDLHCKWGVLKRSILFLWKNAAHDTFCSEGGQTKIRYSRFHNSVLQSCE